MTVSVGEGRTHNRAEPSDFKVELLHKEASTLESAKSRVLQCLPRSGVPAAGMHLILDLFGATRLADMELVENTLRGCVVAGGATLLHIHLHRFEPGRLHGARSVP